MGALDGRVAVITGAGRGLGREHALLLAAEGARIVVNDLGAAADGSGADVSAAQQVVEEIRAFGGEAVASTDDVSSFAGAEALIGTALEAFGDLHVLVNNAGILRDRSLAKMSEPEWDAVLGVVLKGHFGPSHFAAAYWKQEADAGRPKQAAIVNTSSCAGLLGNFGQTNYSAAKAGILAMTLTQAIELTRIGVRANAVAPFARTRLTLQTPSTGELVGAPVNESAFDAWHPGNVSPLVAYLATAGCPLNGAVFHVGGSEIGLMRGWDLEELLTTEGRWTLPDLETAMKPIADRAAGRAASSPLSIEQLMEGFLARHGIAP